MRSAALAAWVLALLCAAPAALAPRAGDVAALAPANEAHQDGEVRKEHYALERGGEVVGALCTITRPSNDELYLERDLRWFAERLWLHQVERHRLDSSHMHYREIRPRARRTLSADFDRAGGACELVEWGEREALRREFALAAEALFPLQAIEHLRRGWIGDGSSAQVLEPQSAAAEVWTAGAAPLALPGPVAGRLLSLARADGTPVFLAVAVEAGLAAQVLGAGTSVARPIDAAEYDRLLAHHGWAPPLPE